MNGGTGIDAQPNCQWSVVTIRGQVSMKENNKTRKINSNFWVVWVVTYKGGIRAASGLMCVSVSNQEITSPCYFAWLDTFMYIEMGFN